MYFSIGSSVSPANIHTIGKGWYFGSELDWISANALRLHDTNATRNQAWTIGQSETMQFTTMVLDGQYNAYLRYRFNGTTPDDGNLHFDQAGRTTLTVTALTPAATYDGPLTYEAVAGFYDLGLVSLTEGQLTIVVDGPTTAGDALIFDELVLYPKLSGGIGSMIIETDFIVG